MQTSVAFAEKYVILKYKYLLRRCFALKLYKFDIRDMNKTEYNKWFSLMDEEKQKKVNRFRFDDDKKRTVAGEMLARKAINKLCGVPEEKIIFGKTEKGKPFAENVDVQFNISHSGNFVVCAADKKSIGVDIEEIRLVNLKVAKRVYTNDELFYLFGYTPTDNAFDKTPDSQMLVRFFELWTAKEAYLKYTGTGLVDNLKELSVDRNNIICEKFGNYIISVYSE